MKYIFLKNISKTFFVRNQSEFCTCTKDLYKHYFSYSNKCSALVHDVWNHFHNTVFQKHAYLKKSISTNRYMIFF